MRPEQLGAPRDHAPTSQRYRALPIVARAAYGFRWVAALIWSAIHSFVDWVAQSVLGISHELTWGGGSGDKTADWIWVLCCAVIALVAATVWLVIDRRRAPDDKIRAALRIVVRYGIGKALLTSRGFHWINENSFNR